ncbi:acyl-CoA dehydrogenase family protein [Amycolatopsis cihanbeyliensis]|uniref:Alkylation response protein AidB-like acyl-CoA dehydrogenase n=1 Tax=Amycolatopsis cihanbeyliensis TaxID=1128664 RepID=A0A542CSC1_AMYCI|nr:acyl-CoA dehydrogenase family protein [Amycolatopsis cihanbeyliensis]TQI93725.1 alkylation response protein AidB-like acyl-CoA dehydrogenase [Amycolatopsis cihanbeyliensis]
MTTPTQQQRDFVHAIGEFCRRELPGASAAPHDAGIYAKLAELGWLGIALPEEYGGSGGGMTDLVLFLEETGYWQAPIGGFATSVITAAAYRNFGNEAQKRRVLTDFLNGRVLSISMSEPGAGSDVGALTCRAERTAEGWVLNGQKTWCSNAHIAEHILLVARTSTEGGKHEGLTMFSVPAGIEGLTVHGIDTMGGREVNDLYLTDCLLPADAVVGVEGRAWPQLMAGLNIERMILAAHMLGTARRAFDDTVGYVRQREQFGRPVGSFQALRHRLADHATELECTRLLVHDVARRIEENPGEPLPRAASMAKLKATEFAKAMALDGMQMMGGYGYATEYGMERLLRSSVVSTVYGGTSEIQRDIIGKSLGL